MTIYPSSTIGSENIHGMTVADNGSTLFNTDLGLSYSKDGTHYTMVNQLFNGDDYNYVGTPFIDDSGHILSAAANAQNGYDLIQSNDGITFTKTTLPDSRQPKAVILYNDTILVGDQAGLLVSHDQGQTFQRALSGMAVSAMRINSQNHYLYISTNQGLYFTNDGKSFSFANLPGATTRHHISADGGENFTYHQESVFESNIKYLLHIIMPIICISRSPRRLVLPPR
jgi:hypothetical protein